VLKKVHDLLPDFAPTQVIADFEETDTAAVRAVFGRHVYWDVGSITPKP